MICPHCKKPIHNVITPELKKMVRAWASEKFSHRDIVVKAKREGYRISKTSVGRILRGES